MYISKNRFSSRLLKSIFITLFESNLLYIELCIVMPRRYKSSSIRTPADEQGTRASDRRRTTWIQKWDNIGK